MVRSVRIRSVAFGIAVLIVAHCFLEGRSPAYSLGVSEEAKAALKERDRLWDQTPKLLRRREALRGDRCRRGDVAIGARSCPRDMRTWPSRWTGWQ